MRDAYADGRGSITVRAKLHIEDGAASKKKLSAKPLIVITELPYQTNKASTPALEHPRSRELTGIQIHLRS